MAIRCLSVPTCEAHDVGLGGRISVYMVHGIIPDLLRDLASGDAVHVYWLDID